MGLTPLFTIITPSFQAAAKLGPTVDSVLSQPRSLFEYLVIDGGSTDGTGKLLEGYGTQVAWTSGPDRGIYDAMNKGITRARGRFLYFLGAGDLLRPDILEAVAARLPLGGAGPIGPTFFYGDVYWVGIGTRYAGRWDPRRFSRGCLCHQAIFYERTIFDLLGLYDTRYPLAADYVLNIRCFGDRRIHKVYADLIIADYEGGGLSTTANDPQFFCDAPGLMRRHLGWQAYLLRRAEMLTPPRLQRLRHRLLVGAKGVTEAARRRARGGTP